MERKTIEHIQDYIKFISDIVDKKDDEEFIITYRGECKEYPTPCVPNIYREDYLKNYEYFEKNIFDEMKANQISKGKDYLENAISAQHDGFPSRLLDVSYNSLVALYFAITPYYRLKESKYDEENGKVFIFFIDKFFCPAGENITKAYEDIISNKDSFLQNTLFSKNHKLIDHLKINNRIIAQQGAFILFQGNDVEYLPNYMYKEILIPAKSKKTLRKELKDLFGIYTGSIYPEAENLIDEIKKKSLRIENAKYNFENELKLLMYNFKNEVKYYMFQILKNSDRYHKLVRQFEKVIKGYKLGFIQLRENPQNIDHLGVIENTIKEYNSIIEASFNELNIYYSEHIESSIELLKIEV